MQENMQFVMEMEMFRQAAGDKADEKRASYLAVWNEEINKRPSPWIDSTTTCMVLPNTT